MPSDLPQEQALQECRRRYPAPLKADSQEQRLALERFKRFFGNFNEQGIASNVEATYAEELYFNDTLKTVHTRSALREYLVESAKALNACQVEIADILSNEQGDYFVRWRMGLNFKRFARGRDHWTTGISHLRFDDAGRVVFHQDYWNAAEGLFQHIPLLGWMIEAIRGRL